MNQGDFAADEPAHENVLGVGDRAKDRVDVPALWMCPPAALDGLADDGFGEARDRSLRGSEDDAVYPDERQRLLGSRALTHWQFSSGAELVTQQIAQTPSFRG